MQCSYNLWTVHLGILHILPHPNVCTLYHTTLFHAWLLLCLSPPPPQLASGEVFGKNQPIALQLLGSDRSREALEGVAMELEDSLYPLLREVGGHTYGA